MSSPEEVLELLRENARYSIEDIARQTDSDIETVEETIAEVESEGVIRGYRAVVDWAQLDDEQVRAEFLGG
jgi:DNA-binding Lrp family transcriptional regulator